jgi:hypothetical protein
MRSREHSHTGLAQAVMIIGVRRRGRMLILLLMTLNSGAFLLRT